MFSKKKGIIIPIKGKGFYINRTDNDTPYREYYCCFNRISNCKKQVYNSFIQTIGNKAIVDLKIHHSIQNFLEALLNSQPGRIRLLRI